MDHSKTGVKMHNLQSYCISKENKTSKTNLCDHRDHGTQRLLAICVVNDHVFTKVTEELPTKSNAPMVIVFVLIAGGAVNGSTELTQRVHECQQ